MQHTFLAYEKTQHTRLIKPEGKATHNEQQEEEFDPYMVFVF